MKSIQRMAVVLILLGALALAYGGFNYTRETNEANPGSVSLIMDDRAQVGMPVWAGAGGILLGGLMFVLSRSPR